jgi:hypothetical protein
LRCTSPPPVAYASAGHYGPGDHVSLHQDPYGDIVFSLQAAIMLSEPGEEFEGGETVVRVFGWSARICPRTPSQNTSQAPEAC